MVFVCLGLGDAKSAAQQPPTPPAPLRILANDNRTPAGTLDHGVLTLHLEIKSGDWYPEADTGPSMRVDALAEEGKPPQIPGPQVRVPQGTEIRVTLHNLLPTTAVVHGMHSHPGDAKDLVEVPSGETRELRFPAGPPGTYQYFVSAGGEMNRGRPFREDSQMSGAFIVDPLGSVASDRVFVIGVWRNRAVPALSNDVLVINGKSWPYTERLTYAAGDTVRWRWINASDVNHPMHMHGSYFRVDSSGDGESDHIFAPGQERTGVTELMPPGSTMATTWNPAAGRWLFHCHILPHMSPIMTVANAGAPSNQITHQHGPEHMAGLVLGITVTGERPKNATQGSTRKLRLLVVERPAAKGLPGGFAYQLEESHRLIPPEPTLPGPPVVLERGRPAEITVINRLHESTAVHWHGMELESYYDGVAGWGMRGNDLTPSIEPGHSFLVRFTPPRAGTFIYHTHMDDEAQMTGGLYGPLIVMEPGAKFEADVEPIFVIGGSGGHRSTEPDGPLVALLNGSEQPATLHWHTGTAYRIRVINISNALVGIVSVTGTAGPVQWRARAKDGADLPASQPTLKDASQLTSPGETYDFDFQPQVRGHLRLEFKGVVLPVKVTQEIDVD